MKNLAQKPFIKKLLILAVSTPILLLGFVYAADWFYKSNWLLQNETAANIRRSMDYWLLDAFRFNTLGYRDYVLDSAPGLYTWRPLRIMPNLDLPESWDGATEFNTIYAEVSEWKPEENTISVFTYIKKPGFLNLNIGDGTETKVIVPLVDDVGRPIASSTVDEGLVTKGMLQKYLSQFDNEEALFDHVSQFNTAEDITVFLAYGFNGLPDEILIKGYNGNFDWEDAFCPGDMLMVSFTKDVDIPSFDHEATVKPDLVILNQGGCPIEYSQVTDGKEIDSLDFPAVVHKPNDRDSWISEYRLFRDDISRLEE